MLSLVREVAALCVLGCSMVIKQIDVCYIFSDELEDDPPIARYGHCPLSFSRTFQLVQLKPRKSHVFRLRADVQESQYLRDPSHLLGGNPSMISCLEKSFKPLMSKAQDHVIPVTLQVTVVKALRRNHPLCHDALDRESEWHSPLTATQPTYLRLSLSEVSFAPYRQI
jgi:hypothetical protein